ncbi:MAG: V-type ATP synthase subunit D, partial [Chlamydiota bacterium]|nr:V-type ATP synthase subunit D [Chlamydiota bacterium]
MADMPSATRMNMLMLKSQSSLAKQGVELLKRKRDALVTEFFSTIRETLKYRKQLQTAIDESYRTLTFAKAIDGTSALESLSMASHRVIQL